MITVERIVPGQLTLSFKYFDEYIQRVRSLGARWNPDNKVWELDEDEIHELDREFEGELYYKTPRWLILGKPAPDYSKMYKFTTKADVDSLGFKLNPFKYQSFGIKFLIDRLMTDKMGFICDDVGLGKTIQSIGAMKYLFDNDLVKDITIVCKKSLKTQWKEEIEKFIDVDADIYVVPDAKAKRLKVYDEVKRNSNRTISILNYHCLLKDAKLIKTDCTIYDEVHVAKKHDGEINKSCKILTANAEYCIFMTGTPIMNKPDDLYGIVSIKNKKYFGGSYKKFEDRYLVKSYGRYIQTVGYRNLDELRDKIQRLILRRTSKEVEVDLPDVLEFNIPLRIDAYQIEAKNFVGDKVEQTEERIYKLKVSGARDDETKRKIEDLEGKLKGFIAIDQIIANSPRLFHFSKSKGIVKTYEPYTPDAKYLSSKYSKLLDLVEERRDADKKVIIFSKYETVVKHLCDFLEGQKIKSVPYYGQMNGEKRDEAVRTFKFDNTVTAIIGTDAMAEGLNLNIADTVINFDLPYNHAIYQQRIGRSRRVGSNHSMTTVYNLITDDTIDVQIWKKIEETKKGFDVFVSADETQSEALRKLSN